ncbi:BlaI/MecI/CopY family transcriptional regulator [Dyadobacter sp. LHD-138]|uniref:BlaI/MecI/CopY family transcriptional regulator n=1 Tax=Dyadobacter sp. LHD-138 TaxID=3071413 RepID=UPI0027DF4EEC|nr:BlaI/MecI/CopY family transcriptional regulator [Dyadobacter sp. LHD-138]MDQ6480726.1 BlaI/MecI/CopY family transcriptional regulator [Dyadobacter sp. LHD-138]
MELSKTEEQLMHYIWKLKKAFMKDLIDSFPEPKPAGTTVATLLKRMQDKGFVGYTLYGNSREYYALVTKTDYFSKHVNGMIKNFFNDSVSQFGSFFAKDTNMSMQELEDLRKVIDEEIKRKKND